MFFWGDYLLILNENSFNPRLDKSIDVEYTYAMAKIFKLK